MKRTLPTIENDGYRLDNAVLRHAENPETFWIPSNEDKEKLQEGNLVKLTFEIRTVDEAGKEEIHGERMWVIITERDGAWFTGTLDNQPLCTDDIKPGMIVHFQADHIIDIDSFSVDIESDKFASYRKELKKVTSIN